MIIPFSNYYFYNLDDLHFFAWDFFGAKPLQRFLIHLCTQNILEEIDNLLMHLATLFSFHTFLCKLWSHLSLFISHQETFTTERIEIELERERESEIEEIWIHWWVLTLMGSFYSHTDLCRSIIENESMNKKEICLYRKLTKGKW